MRMIERRSLPVEILRFFMPDGFDEIGDCCKPSVAISTNPAVFALEVGSEFARRAKTGHNVTVLEVMRPELLHHAIPLKNRAGEIPR